MFRKPTRTESPPHTIISLPVHTAVWLSRIGGTPLPTDVAVHAPVVGLYLPPVSVSSQPLKPPQTIISVPVQTAVWFQRGTGVLASTGVGVHVSVAGL